LVLETAKEAKASPARFQSWFWKLQRRPKQSCKVSILILETAKEAKASPARFQSWFWKLQRRPKQSCKVSILILETAKEAKAVLQGFDLGSRNCKGGRGSPARFQLMKDCEIGQAYGE